MPGTTKKAPRKIALIISRYIFGNDTRTECYRGVQAYARGHSSVDLFMNTWHVSLRHPALKLSDLVRQGVEGFILAGEEQDTIGIQDLMEQGIPFIDTVDQYFPGTINFRPDNAAAGRLAALDFLNRGFRSFGFVGLDKTLMPKNLSSEERERGFVETLRASGYPCPVIKYALSHDEDPGRDMRAAEQLAQWLEELPRPVGILAFNDLRGMHTLEACKTLGLKVPGEVAVIGVENNPLICESSVPALSSVDLNMFRIGYEAAACLDRILHGEKPPAGPMEFSPREVITRASSDILAVDDPIVAKVLMYIGDHLSEPFSVDQLARLAGISDQTLQNHFHKTLGGKSVHDVILDLRLEKAQRLLRDTLLPIDTVADESGFRRGTYLCRVFEARFGISPGKWRVKNRSLR